MSERALDSAAVRQAARPPRPGPVGLDRRRFGDRPVAHLPMGRIFGLGPAAFRRAALAGGAGVASEPVCRPPPVLAAEARREPLHDATEALMGGWNPITPLKPHLGPGFSALVARLQAAVDHRYDLPAWTFTDYVLHKRADRLAAANQAYHVVGWSRAAMREQLGIELAPLHLPPDQRAWEPWPPSWPR